MPSIHLLVKGKVQGVFYRASARKMAGILGVKGWIRNTPEGDVEAMVTGEIKQLNMFEEWCKKGPARAQVEKVIVTEKAETPFYAFTIKD